MPVTWAVSHASPHRQQMSGSDAAYATATSSATPKKVNPKTNANASCVSQAKTKSKAPMTSRNHSTRSLNNSSSCCRKPFPHPHRTNRGHLILVLFRYPNGSVLRVLSDAQQQLGQVNGPVLYFVIDSQDLAAAEVISGLRHTISLFRSSEAFAFVLQST